MEAEGVAPVERAVMQQVEPRRLGRLVAAQVDLQKAQRREHGQHALQRMQIEAGALGQLLGRGRAAALQGFEKMHLVGRCDRRHPVGRQPYVPHHAVVPDRILDRLARHNSLQRF